jgi:hypothetical protein
MQNSWKLKVILHRGFFFVSQVNPDDNDIKTFRGDMIEIYQSSCIEEDFFIELFHLNNWKLK